MLPIEAVTVCVGYGDFLRAAAPFNRPLLDRWVVVTTPADEETRSVCRAHAIECVTTDEHRRDGPFSKGRLVDRGHALLGGSGWTLHVDADVVLPHDFHQLLADAHLDESCVHGCDRVNVRGWEAWGRVKAGGLWGRDNPWMVDPARHALPLGARVANQGHGWAPAGFFQLWHGGASLWRSSHTRRYPAAHGTAARTDIQFAYLWDRRKRVLIPELVVWHLESEPAGMGANWAGRTTRRFGPPVAAAASPGIETGYSE